MPVDADNYALFDDENRLTYLINIAYKAAQIADPDKTDLFLYNLRAASAAEPAKRTAKMSSFRLSPEAGSTSQLS